MLALIEAGQVNQKCAKPVTLYLQTNLDRYSYYWDRAYVHQCEVATMLLPVPHKVMEIAYM